MKAKKTAKNKKNLSHDLKAYYTLGLPLLGLMAVVALAGTAGVLAIKYFL